MTGNDESSGRCVDCFEEVQYAAKVSGAALQEEPTYSMEGQQPDTLTSATVGPVGAGTVCRSADAEGDATRGSADAKQSLRAIRLQTSCTEEQTESTKQYDEKEAAVGQSNKHAESGVGQNNTARPSQLEEYAGLVGEMGGHQTQYPKCSTLAYFGRNSSRACGRSLTEPEEKGARRCLAEDRRTSTGQEEKECKSAFASQILMLTAANQEDGDQLASVSDPMSAHADVDGQSVSGLAYKDEPSAFVSQFLDLTVDGDCPMSNDGVPGAWRVARSNFDTRAGGLANNATVAAAGNSEATLRTDDDDEEEEEGHLAVANPVTLPSAQAVSAPPKSASKKKTDISVHLILMVASIFVLVVGLPLLIFFLLKKHEEEASSDTTTAPSMSPEAIILSSLPQETCDRIMDPNSDATCAHIKAYWWLLEDPALEEHYQKGEWKITQRFALASLYYATKGEHWANNDGWLSYDTSECDWFGNQKWGLTFSKGYEEHLEEVYTFPDGPCASDGSEEFQHLMLSFNKLQGQLPEELYLLTNLRYIYTIGSQLSGTLSSSISKLSKLELLGVSLNELSGTMPTELGLIEPLTGVFTFANQFSGSIPPELTQATKLKFLLASENRLTGVIPTEIGRLSCLRGFRVQTNALTGQIPTQIGLNRNLTSIVLHENNLSGRIPSEIGLAQNLWSLYLFDNLLTGTLPVELFHLANIERFHVSSNPLGRASLPTEIGMMNTIETFMIANISLTGTLPTEIGLLHKLTHLSIQDNDISGTLPAELSNAATSLEELSLSGNPLLTGAMPSDVCNLGKTLQFDCPSVCGCAHCPCAGV